MKFAARFALTALLVGGFSSITAETTQAQLGWGGYRHAFAGGFGGYGGYGFGASPYTSGRVPVPPYFALHPPVYYSVPVARTYGHSPFAYPGFYRTPEVAAPACEPLSMTNPHVAPSANEPPTEAEVPGDDDFAVRPLVIENPYVLDNPVQIDPTEFASIEYLD